jgi:hypothetical protein
MIVGVAWFLEEDYRRIREISSDEMFSEHRVRKERIAQKLAMLPPGPITYERIVVNPDKLIAFAAGRPIDSALRGEYVARVVAARHGEARE